MVFHKECPVALLAARSFAVCAFGCSGAMALAMAETQTEDLYGIKG